MTIQWTDKTANPLKRMDKKAQAKKLRASGMLYKDIGQELGVSATMARKYVKGAIYRRPTAENPEVVNDKNGKLIWWE
jgi:transposase